MNDMLLRSQYTVTRPRSALSETKIDLSFRIAPAEGVEATITEHDERTWQLSVSREVDADGLEPVPDSGPYREIDRAKVPFPMLKVTNDRAASRLLVTQVLDALAFLLDVSLHLSTSA